MHFDFNLAIAVNNWVRIASVWAASGKPFNMPLICPTLSAQAKEFFKSVDQQSSATKLFEALVESFRMQSDQTVIGENTPYDVWVKAIPKAQPVKDGILKALAEMPPKVQTISKIKKRTC